MKTLNIMKGLFLVIITICAGKTFGQVYIDSLGNVGIHDSMPEAALDVEGTFQLQNGSQGENLVLTSDSSGNATWQKINALNMFDSLPPVIINDNFCLSTAGVQGIGSAPASVTVLGNYAYVVDNGSDDLKVIDISIPSSPVPKDSLSLGLNPVSVAVEGNYAYVVDSDSNDIKVIDVSDPDSIFLAGSMVIGAGFDPVSVAVKGDYAYVIGSSASGIFQVIDVSDPSSPSLAGSVPVVISPSALAVQGSYAYVVESTLGTFYVIDVSDPAQPNVVGSTYVFSDLAAVTVQGNYAYAVASSFGQFYVIDVSFPAFPTNTGFINMDPGLIAVVVQDNYAYVLNDVINSLTVMDVSVPSMPSQKNSLVVGSDPTAIAIQGNYVYVIDSGSDDLAVIQLFCANQPALSIDPLSGALISRNLWQEDVNNGNIFNINSGNVGIGNIMPANPLTVFSSSNIRPISIESDLFQTGLLLKGTQGGFNSTFQLIMDNPSTADGQAIRMNVVDDGINYWEFFTANRTADNFGNLIFNECNVGIGTASPSEKLHVVGNICYTGTSAACSDIRYKTSFLPIADALEKITALNGVYYHWNQEMFPDKDFSSDRQIGVIAQEVEALFPEMVLTDQDSYKSVDYSRLTPVLIEAIKEQQAEIDYLKSQVTEMDDLKNRLAKLEGLITNAIEMNSGEE